MPRACSAFVAFLLVLQVDCQTRTNVLTQAEKDSLLELHNQQRCMHNIPLFTWDTTAENTAVRYATDECDFEHSESSARPNLGENLAWSDDLNYDVVSAVQSWYDEISQYFLPNGSVNPNPVGPVGHFTQNVWRTSIRLGCGVCRTTQNEIAGFNGADRSGSLLVCHYGPPGNVIGQEDTHVNTRQKGTAECPISARTNKLEPGLSSALTTWPTDKSSYLVRYPQDLSTLSAGATLVTISEGEGRIADNKTPDTSFWIRQTDNPTQLRGTSTNGRFRIDHNTGVITLNQAPSNIPDEETIQVLWGNAPSEVLEVPVTFAKAGVTVATPTGPTFAPVPASNTSPTAPTTTPTAPTPATTPTTPTTPQTPSLGGTVVLRDNGTKGITAGLASLVVVLHMLFMCC